MYREKIDELIRDAHEISAAHGFWPEGWKEKKGEAVERAIALIHCELSEAVEEDRAGRPAVWYECNGFGNGKICTEKNRNNFCHTPHEACPDKGKKPEGAAVELADAMIRTFDLMGALGMVSVKLDSDEGHASGRLFSDVNEVHAYLSEASGVLVGEEGQYNFGKWNFDTVQEILTAVLRMLETMIEHMGCDPESIILDKMIYNMTRPNLHGKRY